MISDTAKFYIKNTYFKGSISGKVNSIYNTIFLSGICNYSAEVPLGLIDNNYVYFEQSAFSCNGTNQTLENFEDYNHNQSAVIFIDNEPLFLTKISEFINEQVWKDITTFKPKLK